MTSYLSRARLIWAALMVGQLVFGAVVVYLLSSGTYAPRDGPLEVYGPVAWAVLVICLLGAVVLRSRESRAELGGQSAGPMQWMKTRILTAAMADGPVLLALCLLLITGELQPFAVIAGIGFLFGLAMFPTTGPREAEE